MDMTPNFYSAETVRRCYSRDPGRPRSYDHWNIDLTQEWQTRFWAREFGCDENTLRRAVEAAGPVASAVRFHLATNEIQAAPHSNPIAPRNPRVARDRGESSPHIVGFLERDMRARYPELPRSEIAHAVLRFGPLRSPVERELTRLLGQMSAVPLEFAAQHSSSLFPGASPL